MSSAPQSSLEPTFENFAINLLDTENQNNIFKKWFEVYKCVRDVIGKAIGESHLKDYYEQFKKEFDAVFKNDLAECRKIEGAKEKYSYVLHFTNNGLCNN